MMMNKGAILLISFLLFFNNLCLAKDVVPKGDRFFALDITMASDNDYDEALKQALKAGIDATNLAIFWDDYENEPGKYNPEVDWLEIANIYYPAKNLKISLTISVIDTNQKRLPDDLQNLAFNDPKVVHRFKKFLDHVFNKITNLDLVSISIGNEVDGYLSQQTGYWSEFEDFYKQTSTYARTKRDDLQVGTKAMFYGLTGQHQKEIKALNRYSDVILVTYYPLNEDFSVRDPSAVFTDFDKLSKIYTERDIHFLESGYPSGKECGSSEKLQAEFIENILLAWDQHSDQIKYISLTWLTDTAKENVVTMRHYYGVQDNKFACFLGTLGLRTYSGSGRDKMSFRNLIDQIKRRGWK